MSALAALHATRNQAGLSQEDARDIYARMVDKRSTRAMSDAELKQCRNEIIRLYPNAGSRSSKGSRKRLTGKYAGKLQALWIAAWNLGIVRNRDDAALTAFVKRQTGIDHTKWLHDAEAAAKVIEALKKWMEREAGVDWSTPPRHSPMNTFSHGYKIAVAQYHKCARLDPHHDADFYYVVCNALNIEYWPEQISDGDWIIVMNQLGREIRSLGTVHNENRPDKLHITASVPGSQGRTQ